MFEVLVGGQERSKARACCYRSCVFTVFVPNQRQHFFGDVTIVSRQQFRFQLRRHLFVQKTPTIDAVDRIGADLAVLYERLDRINEIKTFVLLIIRGLCRQTQERLARVTVSHQWHFHLQIWTRQARWASLHATSLSNRLSLENVVNEQRMILSALPSS